MIHRISCAPRGVQLFCLLMLAIGFAPRLLWGITVDDASAPPPNLNGTNTWLGVGYFTINAPGGPFRGSGTLIDRYHVLTAAHVVVNTTPAQDLFSLTGTGENVVNDPAVGYYIPAGFTSAQNGLDIAVVTLSIPAPVGTTTWLYNSGQVPDETNLGLTTQLVGFDNYGNGTAGATNNTFLNNPRSKT